MILQRFACPKCRRPLKTYASLVRPAVRCGTCGLEFRPPAATRFGLCREGLVGRLRLVTYRGRN